VVIFREPLPAEVVELLERRKRHEVDHHDEIWDGVLHVASPVPTVHALIGGQLAPLLGEPARRAGLCPLSGPFNVGGPEDCRVPDGGIMRTRDGGLWSPTAALVIEIVSPGDESWQKLAFYAAHDVDEVLIIDPHAHEAHWLGLSDGRYEPIERSGLIDLGAAELSQQIEWP
jgi:Uma2 family endonuclease